MDKPGNFVLLLSLFTLSFLIFFCPCADRLCLFFKGTDIVSSLDFGTVILVLSSVFFQNRLELADTVFVFIQLALNGFQKPLFCQAFNRKTSYPCLFCSFRTTVYRN